MNVTRECEQSSFYFDLLELLIVDVLCTFDQITCFVQLMSKMNTVVDQGCVARLKTFELRSFIDQLFRQGTKLGEKERDEDQRRDSSHFIL